MSAHEKAPKASTKLLKIAAASAVIALQFNQAAIASYETVRVDFRVVRTTADALSARAFSLLEEGHGESSAPLRELSSCPDVEHEISAAIQDKPAPCLAELRR